LKFGNLLILKNFARNPNRATVDSLLSSAAARPASGQARNRTDRQRSMSAIARLAPEEGCLELNSLSLLAHHLAYPSF
jgi:hypothetical protein